MKSLKGRLNKYKQLTEVDHSSTVLKNNRENKGSRKHDLRSSNFKFRSENGVFFYHYVLQDNIITVLFLLLFPPKKRSGTNIQDLLQNSALNPFSWKVGFKSTF